MNGDPLTPSTTTSLDVIFVPGNPDDAEVLPPSPPPPPEEDPCDDLAKEFDKIVNTRRPSGEHGYKGLNHRMDQMSKLPDSSHRWQQYASQVENTKRHIRDMIRRWDENDCGDPPGYVNDVLARVPSSYESQKRNITNTNIVLGVGSAYVIYRILRMMPSLLAPPTIPFNLAIP